MNLVDGICSHIHQCGASGCRYVWKKLLPKSGLDDACIGGRLATVTHVAQKTTSALVSFSKFRRVGASAETCMA